MAEFPGGKEPLVSFDTHPSRYVHWKLAVEAPVARLLMDVQEDRPMREGYVLKTNSYDLGVDIELWDAVERLRFEHPEVRCLIIGSAKDRIFCSGANIYMLGSSTHAFKVNFCKFTNETRLYLEDASAEFRPAAPSPRSTGPARAAGTNSPSPATRSCWWTIPPRRCRSPKSRSSPSCPAPAVSPAWSTSGRSGATSPTSSRASAKGSRASARSVEPGRPGDSRSRSSRARSRSGPPPSRPRPRSATAPGWRFPRWPRRAST